MRLYCVYHIGAMNGPRTQTIVDDQVKTLTMSGLMDRLEHVYVTLVGEDKDTITVPPKKFTKVYDDYDSSVCEFPAMNFIRDFSKSHRNDALLYIHTKGAGSETNTWRKIMEHFCIHNFDTCTTLLEMYLTVGCLMQKDHYAGNFWWTRCNHAADREKPRVTWKQLLRKGIDAEKWIMSPPQRGMHASLFDISYPLSISFPPSFTFGVHIGLYNEKIFPPVEKWNVRIRDNSKVDRKILPIIMYLLVLVLIKAKGE